MSRRSQGKQNQQVAGPKLNQPTRRPQPQPARDHGLAEKPLSSFSEIYRAQRMEGPKVKIADILGKEFIIHSYVKRPSKFVAGQEYAAVQIELVNGGGKQYFETMATAVLDQLEKTAKAIPYRTTLQERQSAKSKGKYLTLA